MFGIFFWVLMLLALVGGVWSSWGTPRVIGMNLFLWVLLLLLGLKVFPFHA